MKRKALRIALLLFAALSVFAQDNPYSVWCDFHSTYFYKRGRAYPSGVAYDIYEHQYYDRNCRCQRVDRMYMRVPDAGT
jgi:hypothetical protein